tara:strand:- start:18828 stop:19715 length:888 start_codon:yes stop_codon:yes gene_type:complete
MVIKKQSQIMLITGLSGSGKTIALQSLEDLGFYCIDNLSPNMILKIIEFTQSTKNNFFNKIAISIDIRSIKMDRDFEKSIEKLYRLLKELNIIVTTIFLYSEEQILLSRFNATRRLHPLSNNKINLIDALKKEEETMHCLKEKSSLVIDTSYLKPSELKNEIKDRVLIVNEKNDISILIQSFGYKNGLPVNSDFVFDVRCLKNPFWDKTLRYLSGKDKKVISFLESDKSTTKMEKSIISFLKRWIPNFSNSDRHYLTISIGCTGGLHRSVFLAEKVYKYLSSKYANILIKHRDIK